MQKRVGFFFGFCVRYQGSSPPSCAARGKIKIVKRRGEASVRSGAVHIEVSTAMFKHSGIELQVLRVGSSCRLTALVNLYIVIKKMKK